VQEEDVMTQGGEIKGARSTLPRTLEKYGIPKEYLKEATGRQAGPDGRRLFQMFDWGNFFCSILDEFERQKILQRLIQVFLDLAQERLRRDILRLSIDRRQSPYTWVHMIIERAKSQSGGVVEQHLVGAKLEKRFRAFEIPNHPAHAADLQTSRDGDFSISELVYHVTAAPGKRVIEKCAANIRAGKYPVLLVPEDQLIRARVNAQEEGVDKEMTIVSIESFVALNIIELATDRSTDFFTVLQEIVGIYNRRLGEVETDLSLQIDIT
jgi:hypothetical protein